MMMSILSRNRLKHGCEVFDGGECLDIVDGVENEPAAGSEDVNLLANLVAHLVRCPERERFLRIDSSAPKDKLAAELLFEPFGVHACRRTLNGIQNIKTTFDQCREKLEDRPAGVLEGFPGRICMNPTVQRLVIGKPEFPERFFGTKKRLLRTEIRTAKINHVNGVTENMMNPLQVRQGDFKLPFKNRMEMFTTRYRGNVPFGNITNSLRPFELRAGHGSDVPETGAADAENGTASRLLNGVKLLPQGGKGLVRNRFEFFKIVFHSECRVVDRFLPDDGVKIISGFRHQAGRRYGAVAAGIDEYVRLGFINLKTFADQYDLSPRRFPFLPVLVFVTEFCPGGKNAASVNAEDVEEIIFGKA